MKLNEAPTPIRTFRDHVKDYKYVDPNQSDEWRGTVFELMRKFGFSQMGQGKYATVFDHPKLDYVIKVMHKDTAYFKWLDFCKANQNNKFVPKIRGKLIKITEFFYAIRLEKLNKNVFKDIYDLIGFLQHPIEALNGDTDDIGLMDMNTPLLQDPDFRKILHVLARNTRLLDVHYDNVMFRRDQPVIIDPFFNYFRDGAFTIDPNDMSQLAHVL